MIPRSLAPILQASLKDFPATLVIGARQVGKTTLVRSLSGPGWEAQYRTLDELSVLDAATTDPEGFIQGLSLPVILDEIQRAPQLLLAIKRRIDTEERPGMFLLTGSANVLTLSSVSETLAGRIAVHELHPFSWPEIQGNLGDSLVDDLFEAESAAQLQEVWPAEAPSDGLQALRESILTGGYPRPRRMVSQRSRRVWFDSYRQTYIERDLLALTNLSHLPDFNRLLTLLAHRTSEVLNLADISRTSGIPATTLRRDINLLAQTFQLRTLAPYAGNVGRALFRTPKLYLTDTGMACHLAGHQRWKELERRDRVGPLLETWVENQMVRCLSVGSMPTALGYLRTSAGLEVDFLLERGGRTVGIEVKATASVARKHRAGLTGARELLGPRWHLGLLHTGRSVLPLDDRTLAVPIDLFFSRRPSSTVPVSDGTIRSGFNPRGSTGDSWGGG